jgi:hypothetical protein
VAISGVSRPVASDDTGSRASPPPFSAIYSLRSRTYSGTLFVLCSWWPPRPSHPFSSLLSLGWMGSIRGVYGPPQLTAAPVLCVVRGDDDGIPVERDLRAITFGDPQTRSEREWGYRWSRSYYQKGTGQFGSDRTDEFKGSGVLRNVE